MPDVKVTPSEALVDVKAEVSISGFQSNQNITIHAKLLERQLVYSSCGHYVTDVDGSVKTFSHSSVGGTFTGVESMGLFWSMKPAPGYPASSRLFKKDVTQPYLIDISVYLGHLSLETIHSQDKGVTPVATTQTKRWYKKDDVKRIVVREGSRLRGIFFLPPGDGPFPGVIDLFGSSGGLVEMRAALLGSRGFAALALGYFGYEDLTSDLEEIDFECFMEAADWLIAHPAVRSDGIGVVGVSKGGECGLLLAENNPKVKAVVNLNGAACYTFVDLKRDGKFFKKGVPVELSLSEKTAEGVSTRNAFPTWKDPGRMIEAWKSDAKILHINGLDDQVVSAVYSKALYDMFPENKKKNFEIVNYPGAGHLIEPPYAPLCRFSLHKVAGFNVLWGGQPKPHADAQEDAWRRTLQFLRRHLVPEQTNAAYSYSLL